MTQVWTIKDGSKYIAASPETIAQLCSLPGAPHVLFGCKCGAATWSAKNIALSASGGYNGQRNIFWCYDGPECQCPPSNLVCIVPLVEPTP